MYAIRSYYAKNETIFRAIAEDNKDSNVAERMKKAEQEAESIKMGNLIEGHSEAGEVKKSGTPKVKKTEQKPAPEMIESDEYLIEESEKNPGTFNIFDQNGERVEGGMSFEDATAWVNNKTKK